MTALGRSLRHLSVLVAFGLLGIFSLYAFENPASTGFVSADAVAQEFNISVQKTEAFELSPVSGTPLKLQSLRISGRVENPRGVNVYLRGGDGSRRLVYTNIGPPRGNTITGMVSGSNGFSLVATGAFSLHPAQVDPTALNEEIKNSSSGLSSFLGQMFSVSDDEDAFRRVESFVGECFETCDMPLDAEAYHLVVDVEPGAVFHLDNMIYTLYE